MKQLFTSLFFASLFVACEQPSRFAPLAIETSRPSRSLPAEHWSSTSQPTGALPTTTPPSLVCMRVDAKGETLTPPLSSGAALGAYRDALACLITISGDTYEQAQLQLRTTEVFPEAPVVLVRDEPASPDASPRSLPATSPGSAPASSPASFLVEGGEPQGKPLHQYLFWLDGKHWREEVGANKRFSVEVVFACEEPDDNEGMGCDFVLSQSFAVAPLPPENRTEPKSIKGAGPKVSSLQCASVNSSGLWAEELTATSLLTEGFFCKVEVENPSDVKFENVTLELRGGASKASAKALTSYLFTVLEPKEKRSYLFRASATLQGSSYTISAAVGRNNTERNAAQQSVTVKVKPPATSAPSTFPTAPEE